MLSVPLSLKWYLIGLSGVVTAAVAASRLQGLTDHLATVILWPLLIWAVPAGGILLPLRGESRKSITPYLSWMILWGVFLYFGLLDPETGL